MKIRSVFFGFGLLGLMSAMSTDVYANQTNCSSHNQNVSYYEWNYTGGAAPHDGQQVSHRKVYIGNLLAQDQKGYQGKPSEGEWTVRLMFKDEVELASTGRPEFGSRDYAARMEIYEDKFGDPAKDGYVTDFWVICRKSWSYAP